MAYCSNCGAELRGAMKYCNKCGYQIDDDEYKIIKRLRPDAAEDSKRSTLDKLGEDDSEKEELKEAEVVFKPGFEKPPEMEIRVPPGTKVKSKVPKSTSCVVCNKRTEDICFFCNYAVCDKHSVKMQVLADKAKIGNVIESCPECADRKAGRQPTGEEAAEIGFFFKIKPYHEWKCLD